VSLTHTDPNNKPPDIPDWICKYCKKPMRVTWHWMELEGVTRRGWVHPTVHDACADRWTREKDLEQAVQIKQEIPERYRNFDVMKFTGSNTALDLAASFYPDSIMRTVAIIGGTGRGKSRLMWNLIKGFFDEIMLETAVNSWVDYYEFSDLMTEYDRKLLSEIKDKKYVFIDNIGTTEAGGQQRVILQDVIRARIHAGKWTFLTIDNMDFDRGFPDLFRDRVVEIEV
jgi:DNA replication protein DnaC